MVLHKALYFLQRFSTSLQMNSQRLITFEVSHMQRICVLLHSRAHLKPFKGMSVALEHLTEYFKRNSFIINLRKMQVCAFHLNNQQGKGEFNIWNNEKLKHDDFLVYLGVTSDQTLSFADHTKKLKLKVATRNNLLGKLASCNWEADPKRLRTTAVALSHSIAEYCLAELARSCHTHQIDP